MGEYVSLGKVENCLKEHFLVNNICVIADPRETFCVALILPDITKLVNLSECLKLNRINDNIQELCQNQTMVREITELLENHAKQKGLKKFEIPRRIHLISTPWAPDTGLVTATFKLKRKIIYDRYEEVIKALYSKDFWCKVKNYLRTFSCKYGKGSSINDVQFWGR